MSLIQPHTSPAPFLCPSEDESAFAGLTDEARRQIRAHWRAVSSILDLRAQKAPRKLIGVTTDYHARLLAISVKRLQNMVSEFVKSGKDWRTLLDKSAHRLAESLSLPAAFIAEWQRRCERHHGSIKAAHKELIDDWKNWRRGDESKRIPGYEVAPLPRLRGELEPEGWSYNNLLDKAPSKAHLQIMRRGLGTARGMLPQVLTTRAELLVGQRWEFDDFEPDVKILCGNGVTRQLGKPLQLSALDVHSGCIPLARWKPSWTREDGAADKWKLAHMRMFVAALLTLHGYDQHTGTVLVLEGGTATLDEDTVEHIAQLTGKKVRVEFPPDRSRRQVVPFRGKSGGNPNKKPHIEAWHLALKNRFGILPGQKGSNYLREPEYLEGMEAEAKQIIKLAQSLPPDRAALLRNPFLDFDLEFLPLAQALVESINRDHDHELEGWEQLGYFENVVRPDPAQAHWLTMDELRALPPHEQEALVACVEREPAVYSQRRRMSRRSVFDRQIHAGLESGRLTRLPGFAACELICADPESAQLVSAIRPRSLTGSYFTIKDSRLALLSGPQIFEAKVIQHGGTVRELPEGDYQLIYNPFAPDFVFVKDHKGRFLGVAPRAIRINPNDAAAVLEAYGYAGHRRAERLEPLRERHADMHREVTRRQDHNQRVAEGKPVTPEEQARARTIAQSVRAVTAEDLQAITSAPTHPRKEASAQHHADAQSAALEDLI